ncbi:hypothetical protein J6590_044117, partial [Homalodisca vitripennis]
MSVTKGSGCTPDPHATLATPGVSAHTDGRRHDARRPGARTCASRPRPAPHHSLRSAKRL